MADLHGRLGQCKRKLSESEKRYKKNYVELNSGRCREGSIRKIKRYGKQNEKIEHKSNQSPRRR